MPFCRQCGQEHDTDARYCGACGAAILTLPVQPAPTPEPSPPSRPARPLLAVAAFGIAFIVATLAALVAFVLVTALGHRVEPTARFSRRTVDGALAVATTGTAGAGGPATIATEPPGGSSGTTWELRYGEPQKGIRSVTEAGETKLVKSLPDLGRGGDFSPDGRYLAEIGERGWGAGAQGMRIVEVATGESIDLGMDVDHVGWTADGQLLVLDYLTEEYNSVDPATGDRRVVDKATPHAERGGTKLSADVESRVLAGVRATLTEEMVRGEEYLSVVEAAGSPDGERIAVGVEVIYNVTPDGEFVDMASQANHYAVYLANADGSGVSEVGEGFAPYFVEVEEQTEKSWELLYVGDTGIDGMTAEGKAISRPYNQQVHGHWAHWSPDNSRVVVMAAGRADLAYQIRPQLIDAETGRVVYDEAAESGMVEYLGWKADSSGFTFDDYNSETVRFVAADTGATSAVSRSATVVGDTPGASVGSAVESRIVAAVVAELPARMRTGDARTAIDVVRVSPDGKLLAVAVATDWFDSPDGTMQETATFQHEQAVYLADMDGGNVRKLGAGIAPMFVETETTIAVTLPGPTEGPKTFTASVPLPTQVSRDPDVIGTNFALALIFALAFGFTSTVFNSAIKQNEAEVESMLGPLARFRERLRDKLASSPPHLRVIETLAILVLSGLIYSFLDPGFGPSLHGLGVFLSFALSVGVVTYAYEGTQALIAHRALGAPARVVLYPAALLIALACVVISRVTGFHPGYVWGFVGGMAFLGAVEPDDRGHARLVLIASLVLITVSMAAWFLSVPVESAITSGATWLSFVSDLCTGVFVAGLEGLAFGLVPLSFMDGEKLFRTGKAVWFVLYVGVVFLFWHVLINPNSAYLDAMGSTSVRIAVVLLVFYVFMTTGVFWYFKLVRRLASGGSAT